MSPCCGLSMIQSVHLGAGCRTQGRSDAEEEGPTVGAAILPSQSRDDRPASKLFPGTVTRDLGVETGPVRKLDRNCDGVSCHRLNGKQLRSRCQDCSEGRQHRAEADEVQTAPHEVPWRMRGHFWKKLDWWPHNNLDKVAGFLGTMWPCSENAG